MKTPEEAVHEYTTPTEAELTSEIHERSGVVKYVRRVGALALAMAATVAAVHAAPRVADSLRPDFDFSHIGDPILHKSSPSEK